MRPQDNEKVYDGLIAQEVKSVIDELGIEWSGWSKNDSDGKQGIQYGALTVPLVKAVQELSTKVDILNKRIIELEYEKINTMGMFEKRIQELESDNESITLGMRD